MKIAAKLTVCFLVALMSIFLLVNLAGEKITKKALMEQAEAEYYEKAHMLADEYAAEYYDVGMSVGEVTKRLRIVSSALGVRIWVLNSKGVVLIDTDGTRGLDISNYDQDFLKETYHENLKITGIFQEEVLCVQAPIFVEYGIKGYVCLMVPVADIEEKAVFYMNMTNIVLLIAAGALLIAFTVVYFITAYPSRKLRKAALEYAKGNYDYKLNIYSHDEFREMADTLKYMVGEIQNAQSNQRKFIANVSHDFRSPLTSIKGYAEAMKDGTIPYESQKKYLDIILFETDRLTKLTTNVLDLNKIDDQGMMLDITHFDINKIIKNTAAAFEGICTQRRIVLSLSFAESETYVDADMGRIQQVLYNLTDNAIKFSHSGSTVEIETEEKGSKALVRVRDHGVGIPKDSIKKIWDRFYKSDQSRGRDKKGTGLGLSIVKEIVNAHGENINVISTEGVGTEFTFTLPRTVE